MKQLPSIALLLCIATLSACQVPPLIHPDGFAVYQNQQSSNKSVSPERVMYRVRSHGNEDKADLTFWKTALKTHMQDSGYIQLAESDIHAGSTPGILLTLASPLGAQDYTYLIAVFVHGDKLIVFEAAGETTYFDNYKDNIIKTIKNTNMDSASRQ